MKKSKPEGTPPRNEPFGWHHWPDHFFLSYQFRRALGETLMVDWLADRFKIDQRKLKFPVGGTTAGETERFAYNPVMVDIGFMKRFPSANEIAVQCFPNTIREEGFR